MSETTEMSVRVEVTFDTGAADKRLVAARLAEIAAAAVAKAGAEVVHAATVIRRNR